MANSEHLAKLTERVWNQWRRDNPDITPDLIAAHLMFEELVGVNLGAAEISGANLSGANLSNTGLSSSRLQSATLDRATLTGARLWETQRAGWSVRGVICERVFWDPHGCKPAEYAPGEFERLHSEQPQIELFYQGGITKFEVNTLPALLDHLARLHPNCAIRLRSIEETGGGAKVRISVDKAAPPAFDQIRKEAERSQAAQIAFRSDEAARWDIEKRLLLDEVFPRMLAVSGQHVHIEGAATGVVIASGYASVDARETVNDVASIRDVLSEIMNRRAELGHSQNQAEQLEKAIREVQNELQKNQPRHPVVSAGLKTVKDFVVGALGNAAGTALATNPGAPCSINWHTLQIYLPDNLPSVRLYSNAWELLPLIRRYVLFDPRPANGTTPSR